MDPQDVSTALQEASAYYLGQRVGRVQQIRINLIPFNARRVTGEKRLLLAQPCAHRVPNGPCLTMCPEHV